MKKILGGLMVAAGLIVAALAGSATAEPAPEPGGTTTIENLKPGQEISFQSGFPFFSNPLKFTCPPIGTVTQGDYTWTIATSSATEGEGQLSKANVVATGGSKPVANSGNGNICHPLTVENPPLREGTYYWQVSRPKSPGPGVEVGEVWTFTIGMSKKCEAATKKSDGVKKLLSAARKRWGAAPAGSARRQSALKAIHAVEKKYAAAKVTYRFYCKGEAGPEPEE
jgi:hypothetical protein